MFGGEWCAWCGEIDRNGNRCGWNSTHSTKFHDHAMSDDNWSVKKLEIVCPKHPLVEMVKHEESEDSSAKETTSGADEGGGSAGAAGINAAQAKAMLIQLERAAQSDEAHSVIESVMTLLGLNDLDNH